MDNCALFLNKIKAQAEDKGVNVCMELLNSKVNHKDYMCDHATWGVELMKRINSPRIKLLYDIYHMQIMDGATSPARFATISNTPRLPYRRKAADSMTPRS